MRVVAGVVVLLLVLMLSACSTSGNVKVPVDERTQPEGDSSESVPGGAVTAPSPVRSLLLSAARYQQSGDLPRAVATLERALRIRPRNAQVWYRLASVRLQQKRYSQAENLAFRSNAYAGSDHRLQAANWRLIAAARYRQRDFSGADKAIARARALDNAR